MKINTNMIMKYWNSTYLYILLLIYCSCMSGGISYTLGKLAGWYPDTPWFAVVLFDCSQIIYLIICFAFILYKKRVSSFTGNDIPKIKLFITITLFIQYNCIVHLFPENTTWSSTFIFIGFVALLFDTKLMIFHLVGYFIFLTIGHILYLDKLVANNIESVERTLICRGVVLFFTSISIVAITYFAEKFLIQAQEKESENIYLMEKQLEYYHNCDLMDRELRKFRHDIKGHFLGMSYLLKNKSYDELAQYFTDLDSTFELHKNLYFSGNMIIDSILNYDLPNNLEPYVEVSVSGRLCEIETLPSIDICTLFSNLLSNAIAAVNQCEVFENPELSISFDSGLNFFTISIVNSVPVDSTVAHSKTLVKGKALTFDRNHGYGIRKIKEICEKYDGIFEQCRFDQAVTTTVYLPL